MKEPCIQQFFILTLYCCLLRLILLYIHQRSYDYCSFTLLVLLDYIFFIPKQFLAAVIQSKTKRVDLEILGTKEMVSRRSLRLFLKKSQMIAIEDTGPKQPATYYN